nr:MAG TPA: hypothetical protein [Caudoviricetes sp.]
MSSKAPCYFWDIYGVETLKHHAIADCFLIKHIVS